jgi:flavin reductase (DIM6/NTAB) family NADH-FMN oxidoreductase RutF
MEITPSQLPHQSLYKIMIGSVVPRPIGWVSTVNAEAQPNLAPFSFFNAVCSNPPTVLFCPSIRGSDGSEKDTLKNIRHNGEFVVNIVSEFLAEAMNLSSAELPPNEDEFTFAGVTPVASLVVKAPRVAESLVHYECKVTQIIDISQQPGGGSVVIGEVVHLHIADEIMIGTDKIDVLKLKPVGRLAGASYCRVNDLFDLTRPPSKIKK